jgi:ribosomal protein S18 acetylase RimI-like enzyme
MAMNREIVFLPEDKYRDYPLEFRYETRHYYEPRIYHNADGFGAEFVKRAYGSPQIIEFTDRLYNPLWEGAQAYGIFSESDAGRLAACIELWRAKNTNIMWINELWVDETLRRQGLGKRLTGFAKEKAVAEKCRVLQLETHSNNENAVAFYFAQGLTFFGFEKALYTNDDIAGRKVCIELGMYLS